MGEEEGLEDEATLPHSTSLWPTKVHTLNTHPGSWGILVLGHSVNEKMQGSLQLQFARRLLLKKMSSILEDGRLCFL